MNFPDCTYHRLSLGRDFKVTSTDSNCLIRTEDDGYLDLEVSFNGTEVSVNFFKTNLEKHSDHLATGIEYILGHKPELRSVKLNKELTFFSHDFTRGEFFQLRSLWHHEKTQKIHPETWSKSKEFDHPVRQIPFEGRVYSRFVPQINATLSFRRLDLEKDLDLFVEWQNQPRVAFYWEMAQSKEELKAFLEKALASRYSFPMIVEINGEPLGYYEMYWVREDRLAPYYDSEEYDRGFHFLIGNKAHLGSKITDSVLKSGLHFLYLDDVRTRRVMAEPRHDNAKVLKYAEASIGWRKVKIFDFPHKRSWLLENSRHTFFGVNAL